jgi:hypothetical protein
MTAVSALATPPHVSVSHAAVCHNARAPTNNVLRAEPVDHVGQILVLKDERHLARGGRRAVGARVS